ncbi:MAG: bifunctional diaminohydroxyphosphoribosylaminopyrimidine deaminase/5-amino-6-(5-phosphoribosylamino)uracil reductase RibD [Opitutales bacterium]|nr:bifunctional diaminohydroxyphosphoribosylaminopyrimidine deaminase/5-amino-6-(5-phosphoribosylamino)uracil reductase RibD [Opitutales bacterium]
MNADLKFMAEAIAAARKAWGNTHPNPAVGAVIVQGDRVVARGYTQPVGGDHAEIRALKDFREQGATVDAHTVLYVTLEPCSTEGRTGACTDAILGSGIRRVVIGAIDPNPAHRGRGVALLQKSGLSVTSGVLESECTDLNLIFNHWVSTGKPFIAAKIATTLDGRIATRGGLSKWITGPKAREDVMRWRSYFPAIAVGSGTVLADDPQLTIRQQGEPERSPQRFIFDRNLVTFRDERPKVYTDGFASQTIVVTPEARRTAAEAFSQKFGIQIWSLNEQNGDGGIQAFLDHCIEANIYGVYIEGGAHLLSGFLRAKALHYLFCYRAPKLLGDHSALAPFFGREPASMAESVQLAEVKHESFGDDQLMRGFLRYP